MAQPRQRRSPNNRKEDRRRKDAAPSGLGAGAVGGAVGAVGGGAAGSLPGATSSAAGAAAMVEGTKAQAKLIATIVAALVALLLLIQRRRRVIIRDALGKKGIPLGDVDTALAEEDRLEAIYQRRAEERMKRALEIATKAKDESARAAAIDAALRRERYYARLRAAAAANRVLAGAEREQMRKVSPRGAYWSLGDRQQHTPDCLAMAGKFWPWSILNIVHPLLHTGCGCYLRSYGDALAAGLLKNGAMLSPEDQARIAAPVIQHVREQQKQLDQLAEIERVYERELSIRERLVEDGRADLDTVAAAPFVVDTLLERFDPDQPRWPKGHPRAGQWRPKISTVGGLARAKVLKAIQDDLGEHMTNVGALGFNGSDDKAEEIGKKVMELVDQHGTVPAYRKRLHDLEKLGAANAIERRKKILSDVAGIDDLTEEELRLPGIRLLLAGGGGRGSSGLDFRVAGDLTTVLKSRDRELDTPTLVELHRALKADAKESNAAWTEKAKVEKDLQVAHRDALLAILGTQREMGGTMEDAGVERSEVRYPARGNKGLIKAIKKNQDEVESHLAEALKYIPADWLAAAKADGPTDVASAKMPKGTGGFFIEIAANRAGNVKGRDLKLLNLEGDQSDLRWAQSVALHEFLHRVELVKIGNARNPLSALGAMWRDNRATGSGTLPGYGSRIRGKRGPWEDAYTGRVYNDGGRNNEVLTTAAQALFFPKPKDLASNKEPQDLIYWVAGLMAAY